MNKELEAILLTENESRLDKINDFFEEDYSKTLREMFVVLLESIRTKTINDINTIMSNIETIILNQDSKNFKIINSAVRDANNRMQEVKKYADNNEFKKIKFELVDLNRKMAEKKEENANSSLYNFYHYLIFEEKNLDMIELILKNEKNILGRKDEFGNNLLYNVIDKYCSLHESEQKEEINYFYEVIILILKNVEDKILKEDKEYYLDLLNRKFCKCKCHVKEIIERFQEFYLIDQKNLENKYNIYSEVHDSVLEEINSFKFDTNGRRFIKSNFITIDSEGATCLDDAVSLKKKKDGSYDYYIAITDVPSFVPYGSLTFYDAMKKIETLYLCDKIINMFPDKIADDYCSLIPNQNRNVLVYKTLVDPSYNVDYDSLEIIPGIINVRDRLTYKQVNKQINLSDDTAKMLEDLALISFKLKSQNKAKEKYRKIENLINSEATYHHSMFADTSISANIVQESMLLTNYLSARYFDKNDLVYIFRNLQIIDEEFASHEVDRLLTLSHVSANEINCNKVLHMLREIMLTAHYSTENYGHKGLGYKYYSHSTSSARRFADSFNQYLTHEQLFKGQITDKRHYELEEITKEIVTHINQKKKENAKFESEYNYLNSKKLIRKR